MGTAVPQENGLDYSSSTMTNLRHHTAGRVSGQHPPSRPGYYGTAKPQLEYSIQKGNRVMCMCGGTMGGWDMGGGL